jgi:hypothetical protein
LRLSRRPALAIDTDVPRANEVQRSASGGRLSAPFVAGLGHENVPGLPQMPVAYTRGDGERRPGVFTRNSMLEPGVGGR